MGYLFTGLGDVYHHDTIRDAILTRAPKPTRVSLIYRTEPTTKKWTKKRKSKKVETDTVAGIRESAESARTATL